MTACAMERAFVIRSLMQMRSTGQQASDLEHGMPIGAT